MKIEHIAIWTHQLETLKDYYIKYFGGTTNQKYFNSSKYFESYFISFESGARLEIMQRPDIPVSQNNPVKQFTGIIHMAFEVGSEQDLNQKAIELKEASYSIVDTPRKTRDGYFEFVPLDPDNNRIEIVAKK